MPGLMKGFLDRQQLYAALSEAKVILLPSIWEEPFGRVPLEAALCRKPVVAFEGGGYGETIVDNETGYVVPYLNYGQVRRKYLFDRQGCLQLR